MGKTVKRGRAHRHETIPGATIGYGTIRTRGSFHRRFPCFHVAAVFHPRGWRTPKNSPCVTPRVRFFLFLSLSTHAYTNTQTHTHTHTCMCNVCIVDERRIAAFLTPRRASTLVEIVPIIRSGREEFNNKGSRSHPVRCSMLFRLGKISCETNHRGTLGELRRRM